MSLTARQQAGRLRAILVRNFRTLRVKEKMANVLRSNGQVASGNLINTILSKDESKSLRIRYKIDREFNVAYDVSITYTIDLQGAPYAQTVDTVLGKDKRNLSPTTSAIEQWISQKLSNGTWRGDNMYIINSGGKTYSYPLTERRYRNKLAYLIARSIKKRGYLQNRSPYLTIGELNYELAILQSVNEFELLWEDDTAEAAFKQLMVILKDGY